ncbi:MAG: CPBP family intramembrane glutamic endopeptidase [Planctomycetota bacterium]
MTDDQAQFPREVTPGSQEGACQAGSGEMPVTPASQPAREGWPYRQEADPGTRASRLIAWAVALGAFLVVVGLQNIPPTLALFEPAPGSAETAAEETTEGDTGGGAGAEGTGTDADRPAIAPPGSADMVGVLGKMYVKLAEVIGSDPTAMTTFDQYAQTDVDRLRAAIVAAEIDGAPAAIERLTALNVELDADDPLALDASRLLVIYAEGMTREDPFVTPESAARLERHHGYFAEVALTFAADADDPLRRSLRGGGVVLMFTMLAFGTIVVLAILSGFLLFITAVVLLALGKLKPVMPVPAPGGSVFLEVFAVFVLGFLALQGVSLVVQRVAGPAATWTVYLQLGLQWLLLLAPLWPLVRGMRPARLVAAIGFHRGRGVLWEVGCGVLGYLAGLPVFLAGVLVTLALLVMVEVVRGAAGLGEPPAPTNPILELLGGGSPVLIVMVVLLATVWAPLCEELVFRGALQRHLRSRRAVPVASVLTAVMFAFMHGYGFLLVCPLIALGTVFSLMREWRGSLIAPITAHALHNGTIMVMLISTLYLLG